MTPAVTREEALAPYPSVGVTQYAPATFVRWKRDPTIPTPIVEPERDDTDERGLRPQERWAPAVRARRGVSPLPADPDDAEDDQFNHLSREALARLQQRLHSTGRWAADDDDERAEDRDGDDPPRDMQRQQAGGDGALVPPRHEQRVTLIPDIVRSLLVEIVGLLAHNSRRPVAPEIPQHVMHAFYRKVVMGAYFVKYPERGNPHQRFFRLHTVHSENYGRQPYLEYSTHAEAVSVKGRVHMAYLAGFNTGVQNSPAFQRFLTTGHDGRPALKGPIYDMKRADVAADYTFTLVFITSQQQEFFSLVTLDKETYHCWVLVLSYLASVNVHVDDTRRGGPDAGAATAPEAPEPEEGTPTFPDGAAPVRRTSRLPSRHEDEDGAATEEDLSAK
jgi:hypothetical protein